MNITEAIDELYSEKRKLELGIANAIKGLLDDFTKITHRVVQVKRINVRLTAQEEYAPVVEVELSI